jgi:hypothetical protein
MPNRAAFTVATAALLLLELLPRVVAHGDEHNDMSAPDAPQPQAPGDDQPKSYWSLSEHTALMYWHITSEVLAWVVVLPVGKRSKLVQARVSS